MKVLISGGAGFIGSSLALKLLTKKYNVRILDNLSSQIHGKKPDNSYTYNLIKNNSDIEFINGDVRDRADWQKALVGIDVVVHLAAETGTGQSMYEVEKYVNTNIGGTATMLDELTNDKTLSVKKLIVASSRAIYGEGKYKCSKDGIVYPKTRAEEDMLNGDFRVKCPACHQPAKMLPTDEASVSHPESVYGYTKKVQEELSLLVGKSIGLSVLAFRFQNVYGPGQSLKNPYTGILSIFSTQIKNGNDICVFEDGKESRDFVYIDDAIDAIILGIESKNHVGEAYNVGAEEEVDVLTVAETLRDKYHSNVKVAISGNFRLGDIRSNVADLTKIRRDLHYRPKINFQVGISNFVDWVEQQEIERDNYSNSIAEMHTKGLYK